MKRLISYSKIFQLILMLIFFLPFFKGCKMGPSAEELETQRIADSTKYVNSLARTEALNIKEESKDSFINDAKIVSTDSINNEIINDSTKEIDPGVKKLAHEMLDTVDARNKEEFFFNRINNDSIKLLRIDYEKRESNTSELIKRHRFLKPFLQPYNGHSGIGFIIDFWFSFIYLFGVYVSLMLILFVSVFKIIDYHRYIVSNIVFNILGFVFLFNTYGSSFFYGNYLWGYWICLLIWLLLLMFDIIIIWFNKKKISKLNTDS